MKQNLTIIPIINKIDLPHANVPETRKQLEDILAIRGRHGDSGPAPRRGLALMKFWRRS